MGDSVFTIGHSSHPLPQFLCLLQAHQITAVADVRSVPYSKFCARFNRDLLPPELQSLGISYVYLGEELGARSKDPAVYVDGIVQYELLARTDLFRKGLERVHRGMERYRIALMCTERDPLDCHRAILIARELCKVAVPVTHILQDGHLESHGDSLLRLISLLRLEQSGFSNGLSLIEQAYQLQEEVIHRKGLAGHGKRLRA